MHMTKSMVSLMAFLDAVRVGPGRPRQEATARTLGLPSDVQVARPKMTKLANAGPRRHLDCPGWLLRCPLS